MSITSSVLNPAHSFNILVGVQACHGISIITIIMFVWYKIVKRNHHYSEMQKTYIFNYKDCNSQHTLFLYINKEKPHENLRFLASHWYRMHSKLK